MSKEQDLFPSKLPKSASIGDELRTFINNIDSLYTTIDPMMLAIATVRDRMQKNIDEYTQEYGEIEREEAEERLYIRFELERGLRFLKFVKKQERYLRADRLIPRSIIISLISQYDVFLGKLIHVLAILYPKSLNIDEKSITFSQLQSFDSIENAREYLIEKEIDAVLRMSHSEQFDWLEDRYKLPLRKDLRIWPLFIEATERRNLFVHTGGIISRQYLKVCKEHGVNLPEDIGLGDELHVTNEYFTSVYECIFEMGVGLAHVLWRKILPSDRKAADNNLNDICYELLVEEKFQLACALLDFATKIPTKYVDEYHRLMFIVNRAQAYKWLGDQQTAKNIINTQDWSATNIAFRLAKSVILDDFVEADKLVREIGPNGEVDEVNYREWPLFREYRKTEGFLEAFQSVFGKSFHLGTVETVKSNGAFESHAQIDISIAGIQSDGGLDNGEFSEDIL